MVIVEKFHRTYSTLDIKKVIQSFLEAAKHFTNEVTKQILASYVDRKRLRNDGMDYIEECMALAIDFLTFINLFKLNLSTKLKVDLLTLDNTEC